MSIAIGELSRLTGVKMPTIRYYEGAGLMPEPMRTTGKQRRYDEAAVSRLSFIRRSRELGFEVDAIRELLALSLDANRPCVEISAIARRHVDEVRRRIELLTKLQTELRRILDQCDQGLVGECRVIEILADHSECSADSR